MTLYAIYIVPPERLYVLKIDSDMENGEGDDKHLEQIEDCKTE